MKIIALFFVVWMHSILCIAHNADSITGSIQIITTPESAEIRFNGRVVGYSPLNIASLLPGSFTMVVEKNGFLPYSEVIQLNAGEQIIKKVHLKPLGEYARGSRPTRQRTVSRHVKPQSRIKQNTWIYDAFSVSAITNVGFTYGIRASYLNKVGIYFSTMIDESNYWLVGSGLLVRNVKYGSDNDRGLYTYLGGGSDFLGYGYYYEIGEMLDLGHLTISLGLSQASVRDYTVYYQKVYKNPLSVQVGIGFNF